MPNRTENFSWAKPFESRGSSHVVRRKGGVYTLKIGGGTVLQWRGRLRTRIGESNDESFRAKPIPGDWRLRAYHRFSDMDGLRSATSVAPDQTTGLQRFEECRAKQG